MGAEEAARMLAAATIHDRNTQLRGRRSITSRLQIMTARFWLGKPIDGDVRELRAMTAGTQRGKAFAELLFGQLLMSRKLAGAGEHLDAGFRLAAGLLAPADYFAVRRRHLLLRRLRLGLHPSPPVSLHELLAEAAVIHRLETSAGKTALKRSEPGDTAG